LFSFAVLFTRATPEFLDLNLDAYWLLVLIINGRVIIFIVIALLFLPDLLLGKLQPGLEGDLEVHDCQEGIYTVLLLDDVVVYVIVVDLLLAHVFLLQGQQEDLVLGSKLDDLHFLVDFHVSVSSSHASVE
jgi:hypothetical protein